MLDTFQCHWKLTGTKPSLELFDIPGDIDQNIASTTANYFRQLDEPSIDHQLTFISGYLFPAGLQRRQALLAKALIHHQLGASAAGSYPALGNPATNSAAQIQPPIDPELLLLQEPHTSGFPPYGAYQNADGRITDPSAAAGHGIGGPSSAAEHDTVGPLPITGVITAGSSISTGVRTAGASSDAGADTGIPLHSVAATPAADTLADLLKQKDHVYSPVFRDHADLARFRRDYEALNDKSRSRNDATQEEPWATQVTIVGDIFAAIADFTEAKDKVNSAA